MKPSNLIISALLALTTCTAFAKDVKVGKNTKQIMPSKYIHVFNRIDWYELEKEQSAGKSEPVDFHVMTCDDHHSAFVEIEFDGIVGKDIRVESDNCRLEGAFTTGWETTLRFDGPDFTKGDECVITIEKKEGNKKIRTNYNLHDSC